METYITKMGEMIDLICWRHYGHLQGVVEAVFEANPGLSWHDPVLPAGIEILLPRIAPKPVTLIRLYD